MPEKWLNLYSQQALWLAACIYVARQMFVSIGMGVSCCQKAEWSLRIDMVREMKMTLRTGTESSLWT